MSQRQPGLAPQCVIGEDPDVLTFEMPVDELERTVRQRCKCKRLSLLSFSSKETHNGGLFCICSIFLPVFVWYFPFPPENAYLQSSEQTNTKGGTVYYFEILRNKQQRHNHNKSEWIFSQSVSESLNKIKTY